MKKQTIRATIAAGAVAAAMLLTGCDTAPTSSASSGSGASSVSSRELNEAAFMVAVWTKYPTAPEAETVKAGYDACRVMDNYPTKAAYIGVLMRMSVDYETKMLGAAIGGAASETLCKEHSGIS